MLLNFGFLIFGIALILLFVVANKQVIKESLVESNIYSKIIPTALESIDFSEDESTGLPADEEEGSLSLDDPEVRKVIEQSLSPEFIQLQVESVLDDVFLWLDGSNNLLDFEIDLTDVKSAFIVNLSDYTVNKIKDLPPCTYADAAAGNLDIFNLKCKPLDFSEERIREQISSSLSDGEFLSDTVITKSDIVAGDGQTLEESLSIAPKTYSLIQNSLFISVAFLIFVSIIFVAVRLPVTRGLQSLGRRLLASSLVIVLFAVVFKFLLPGLVEATGDANDPAVDLGKDVIKVFLEKVDIITVIGFMIIALTGVLLLLIEHFLRKTDRYKLKTHTESRKTSENPKKSPVLNGGKLKSPPESKD